MVNIPMMIYTTNISPIGLNRMLKKFVMLLMSIPEDVDDDASDTRHT